MKNILFIPIDNRPITYSLTKQISQVNKSLNLKLPERNLLGGLVESADIEGILDWLKFEIEADLIILSLDFSSRIVEKLRDIFLLLLYIFFISALKNIGTF